MASHRENLTTICSGKGAIYTRADSATKNWTARTKNPEGKGYITRNLKTRDKEEARELASRWLWELEYKIKNGLVIRNRTVSQIADIYLKELQEDIDAGITDARKMRDQKPHIETYIKGYLGNENIDNLTQADIERFKKWCLVYWVSGPGKEIKEYTYERNGKLIKNPAKKPCKQLSDSTLSKICMVLNAVFKVAIAKGAIKAMDVPNISKTIKVGRKKTKAQRRRPDFTDVEYRTLTQKLKYWFKTEQNEDQKTTEAIVE